MWKIGQNIKIKETPDPHIFEYYLLKYANYEYIILDDIHDHAIT
jgi:hypothetical protein